MKVLVRVLAVVLVLLIAVVVVVGPGRIVAGVEYPFGVGPWSSTGHYCHNIAAMTRMVDQWKNSGETRLSATQQELWFAYQTTLTTNGPEVPKADFTAWYRRTGKVAKTITAETTLINTWWNANCADAVMITPASLNRDWSGLMSNAHFAHYSKNIVHMNAFIESIK
jgi:hypothetical protein